ncbi:MAG: PH domain-containing protein [Fimbriimonadaceae bacterium]|nr:PH domain-containing protein [Chthonomonadaceae bacterium]MCO5295838.1 PH domain-containing protein [Fimbriimonadaceae bacterium]
MRRLHGATMLVEAIEFLRRFLFTVIVVLAAGSRREGMGEIVIAGVGALTVAVSVFRYATTRYGFEGAAFVVTSGLVWKQNRTIPLARIQNVNVQRNVLHRILGVSQVDIQTASGSAAEASLKVLSEADAQELKHALLGQTPGPAFEVRETPPSLFQVELRDLMLAGAFQNRSLYLVFAVLGLMQGPELMGFVRRASGPATHLARSLGVGALVLAGFLLLLVGWFLAIAGTVTKYYGFHIARHEKGLKVGFGLLTQIEHVIPLRRVQYVRVVQPWLYRLLGLCEMDVATAGSFGKEEGGGTTKLAPVVREENAGRLGRHVFADLPLGEVEWSGVSPLTIRRGFLAIFWPCLLGTGLLARTLGPWMGALLPVFLALGWIYARKRHAALGYAIRERFLCVRGGVLKRSIVFIPLERVQYVEAGSSPFQRALGLATLRVRTASSFATPDAVIPDLPAPVAHRLQDEIVKGARVSGL